MKRRALQIAATAILTLATAASAAAAPPPKALTQKYPLGTQTLSHSTSSSKQPGPAPEQPGATQTLSHPASANSPKHRRHGLRGWELIALVAVVGALVVLWAESLLSPGRVLPRLRHQIPRPLLFVLTPIFRYDEQRDAWILRAIGHRHGPVLTPRGYRPVPLGAHARNGTPASLAPDLAPRRDATPDPSAPWTSTPDPFAPAPASRPRPRRNDRDPVGDEDAEPPPLVIRPREE